MGRVKPPPPPPEWAKLPMDVVRAAVEATPKRLRAVVQKGGGFIE